VDADPVATRGGAHPAVWRRRQIRSLQIRRRPPDAAAGGAGDAALVEALVQRVWPRKAFGSQTR